MIKFLRQADDVVDLIRDRFEVGAALTTVWVAVVDPAGRAAGLKSAD